MDICLPKALDNTEKIRIIIGIGTDKQILNLIEESKKPLQDVFEFSHAEAKEEFANSVATDIDNSEDSRDAEQGVYSTKDLFYITCRTYGETGAAAPIGCATKDILPSLAI